MATETKAPDLVATALDAMHKLLAYRWINGTFHDEGTHATNVSKGYPC